VSAQAPTSPPPFGAEQLALAGTHTVGFSEVLVPPTVAAPGPWKIALTTSVLSAVTGWVLDGVSKSVRNRRRR